MVKNPLATAGKLARAMGSVPGLGRSPGGEHSNPLQYSPVFLPGESMDRGAGQAAVQSVAQSQT